MNAKAFAALAAALLAGCAGHVPLLEKLAPPAPEPKHHRDFVQDAVRVCEASRRVLLGEGYVVERRRDDEVVGAREDHVTKEDKDEGYAHRRVYVTCAARDGGSTLYVTATEEQFGIKVIRDSTLIGLPLVSPISIGTRTEGEQQVKFRGRTVEEQAFYDDFYRAVRKQIAMLRPEPAALPRAESPAPARVEAAVPSKVELVPPPVSVPAEAAEPAFPPPVEPPAELPPAKEAH